MNGVYFLILSVYIGALGLIRSERSKWMTWLRKVVNSVHTMDCSSLGRGD